MTSKINVLISKIEDGYKIKYLFSSPHEKSRTLYTEKFYDIEREAVEEVADLEFKMEEFAIEENAEIGEVIFEEEEVEILAQEDSF